MNNCKKCSHTIFVYSIVNKHLGQYCAKCGAWQKWMPQNNPIDIMYIGKYRGQKIADIVERDREYAVNLLHNLTSGQITIKNPEKLIQALKKHLSL